MNQTRLHSLLAAFFLLLLLLAAPTATYGKTIVPVNHAHTIEEIVAMSKLYPHSGFDARKVTSYETMPSLLSPYKAGSLAQPDLTDAENAVKMVRFLAGVPYESVAFPRELNRIAQHGAVLLAASSQLSHTPDKPSDMANDFYRLAYFGCSEANISTDYSNLANGVLGFMQDSDANNLSHTGNRRWILNPGNQSFGMGYACNPNAAENKHHINMHVFSENHSFEYEPDSYIAWPSAGAFPIQYLTCDGNIRKSIHTPFSVSLGSLYSTPTKESIVVKLTRMRDKKVWIFDKSTADLGKNDFDNGRQLHLAVDSLDYGIRKTIIFRPDASSLGRIYDGDVFTVDISGIRYTDGTSAVLSYSIHFFDLYKAVLEAAPSTPLDPAVWNNPFTDVHTNDWYYHSVAYVHLSRLVYGLTESEFDPNAFVTRGMLIAVLHRAEGAPDIAIQDSFVDVRRGSYYEKAILWAKKHGIVSGYTDTLFAPDDPVSREQMAAILYRYAGFKGLSVENTGQTALTFLDKDSVAPYARQPLIYCTANKLMMGRTTELFMPKEYATRAEMAAILQRLLCFIDHTSLPAQT